MKLELNIIPHRRQSGKSKPDSIVDFDEHGKRIGKRPIN